jgi:hypothetical protein
VSAKRGKRTIRLTCYRKRSHLAFGRQAGIILETMWQCEAVFTALDFKLGVPAFPNPVAQLNFCQASANLEPRQFLCRAAQCPSFVNLEPCLFSNIHKSVVMGNRSDK